jgi:membrane protein implicated in regulation of membrane protease activity
MTETANEANEAETFSEPGSVAPAIRLLDREAIVTETIQPDHPGRVRYRGSWWSARCDRDITLLPNTVVYVIGRYHLTLLVEPKV